MSNLEELEVKNVCSLSCDAPTNMCSLLGDHTCGDGGAVVQVKQKPDDYVNVTIELDDVDITSAETKATTVPEDKESAIVEALKRFKMIQQE